MSLYDRIPDYLLEKFQMSAIVLFKAFCSIVVLLCSAPFSSNIWFSLSLSESFGFTVLFFIISLTLVSVSRRMMYVTKASWVFTYWRYFLWCFTETAVLAALYTIFTEIGIDKGLLARPHPTEYIFIGALCYLIVTLGLPEVFAGMYFAINEKNNTIRLLNYSNVVSDDEPAVQNEKKITLADNNGLIKLSISLSNLLFLEADDNYIKVWYENSKGELKQYMLRCKLKTIEDSFADSALVRCHRKYIVNITKVHLMTKDKNGYLLDLDKDTIEPIPVSKTYEENVLERFNTR